MPKSNTAEKSSFIPYARQSISSSDIEAVTDALRSDFLTRGPKVTEFEEAIAEYCGAQHAVAFNSGTTALQAAAWAAEVEESDRYLTTANTFVATAGAGWHGGATLIFSDVDPNTGAIDLEKLAPNLEIPTTRGKPIVVPVHYAGVPVDMQGLDLMISDPNSVVIEDAAAAFGSRYDAEHRVGCCEWSQMTTFSFHPAKHLTTGEGGMVTTNDEALAHRLRLYRNNGIERDVNSSDPWAYEVHAITGNYNFTDFQAALGLSQLARLEALSDAKRQVVSWYLQHLPQRPEVKVLPRLDDPLVVPHMMTLLIDFDALGIPRIDVMRKLRKRGIGTQVHYTPTYHHPVFVQKYGKLHQYFPGMEKFYSQALSLPLYAELTEKDVIRVCETLTEIVAGAKSSRAK